MKAATTEKRRYRMGVRAQRSEATAQRIREAALEQFLSRAFEDVTLGEIADAAEVTVPTLIAHFGRKEDLFVAALTDWVGEMIELREEAPAGDYAGAIHYLLEHYDTAGNRILHLLAEEDRFPTVRAMADEGRKFHRIWVERVFGDSLDGLRGAARERLAVQLIVATDLLSWKLMRLDMGLSRHQTEAAILGTIMALTGGG